MPEASLQVWRLHLGDIDRNLSTLLRPLTTAAEHERANRFRFEADRHRHLAGRALLRTLLAHHGECDPLEVRIDQTPAGKPHVDDWPSHHSPPHVNIAHADAVVAVALSWDFRVGIDVEPHDRIDETKDLAERVLTDREYRYWDSLPPAERAPFFMHLWTCKEAFLKATGTGLRRGSDTFECVVENDRAVALQDADGLDRDVPGAPADPWALHAFHVTDEMLGAVVRGHDLPSDPVFADARSLILEHPRS